MFDAIIKALYEAIEMSKQVVDLLRDAVNEIKELHKAVDELRAVLEIIKREMKK